MAAMPHQREPKAQFTTDAARWGAVVARDRRADNLFFYCVKTTGIYCRPGCSARLPRREHVQFVATAAEAERAGFRACRRCRPKAVDPGGRQAEAVARACGLIEQGEIAPALARLAGAAGMSVSHFHRMFKLLTGLTPKAYAMAHRGRRVREALEREASVTGAMYAAGFNSSGRFYETSGGTLGMTPSAFRARGAGRTIRFAVGECSLGVILVAATEAGICWIAMGDDAGKLVEAFQERFARAELIGGDAAFERWVAEVVGFVDRPAGGLALPLDVQGTAFEHRVWRKLREIPYGQTRSYTEIAEALGEPRSARAVARACAANPAAVAIPCHRVVRRDGGLAGYRWGVERKADLLRREGRGS